LQALEVFFWYVGIVPNDFPRIEAVLDYVNSILGHLHNYRINVLERGIFWPGVFIDLQVVRRQTQFSVTVNAGALLIHHLPLEALDKGRKASDGDAHQFFPPEAKSLPIVRLMLFEEAKCGDGHSEEP
jgi:hypothetical protein